MNELNNEYKYIDYNKYFLPSEVENYELFIGPSGEYYKVKTTYESDQNCTHYKWAIGYFIINNLESLKQNIFIKNKCKSELDILVNYFGFIRYTHIGTKMPLFDFPNRDYFGCSVTAEQKEAIYDLLTFNKENIDEDFILKLENSQYEKRIDNYFNKIR